MNLLVLFEERSCSFFLTTIRISVQQFEGVTVSREPRRRRRSSIVSTQYINVYMEHIQRINATEIIINW